MCAKDYLMKKQEKMFLDVEILPTDIILLVNYGWLGSFAKVSSNLHAIYKRG
jgi:hypothetical protein